MYASFRRGALALLATTLFCTCSGAWALTASAGTVEYRRNAELSLTGNCAKSAQDPVPDPGCPYPPPPDGPSERFNEPRSVAIDAYGDEYVASLASSTTGHIDVFDDEGNFITELSDPFGPKSVAVDSKGNLYVWERGAGVLPEVAHYTPTAYEPEVGNIEYSAASRVVIPIAETPSNGGVAVDLFTDRLYVAEGFSIQVFKPAADPEPNGLIETISGPKIAWTNWLAIDHQRGRIYASFCKSSQFNCGIVALELGSAHAALGEVTSCNSENFISPQGWIPPAVDEETGNFFVGDLGQAKNIYQFDENFQCLGKLSEPSFEGGNAFQIAFSNSPLKPGAVNRHFLFVPIIGVSGSVYAFEPFEELPPDISQAAVGSIGETEAELSATVASEGAETEYTLEYEAVGSGISRIAAEGSISAKAQPLRVTGVAIGLSPGTEYRFRAFASNSVGTDQEEVLFLTYPDATVSAACPNQSLRLGASSAALPDCRAYELVTPPDTNGHVPEGIGLAGDRFSTVESSPLGDRLSFIVKGGVLPGMEGTGSFDGDPYLATRGVSGWTTAAAGPPGMESNAIHPGSTSSDQRYSFWEAGEKGPAVVEPGDNHYVRYPDGHSELVGTGSEGIEPRARGDFITENGTHIVFETVNPGARPLEPDSPPEGTTAVYDRTEGSTHVASLLPGTIGSPQGVTPAAGENATYRGASPDGAGIAFEIGSKLYLRLNNAVTYDIGESVEFAGVSEGGGRVFYVESGDLLAFDTGSKQTITFAQTGDAVPVNVAADGARAYFLSDTVVPGSGQNPQGSVAQAGEPNLYLSHEGDIRFVATVDSEDVDGEYVPGSVLPVGLGVWTDALALRQPSRDTSRLNPDGTVLLFQSKADLDAHNPEGTSQVYRYDSVTNKLHCLSCSPIGAAAGGGASLQSVTLEPASPVPFSPFGFVPDVTPNGQRAFFESTEALVASDTDEVRDVYEWEEDGTGTCARPGGCIYLISSGRSGKDNFLYGQSTSGDDVFFTTGDVLVGSDTGGTLSIYDAKVGGGFAEPQKEDCAGEACKPILSTPPPLVSPAKPSGPNDNVTGNVRCPRGKHKVKHHGKVRCVRKKHHKHHHRRAGAKKNGGSK